MRITYDKSVDVLYIKLKDGQTDGAESVHDLINIIYSKDDQIAGIELFAVSKYADHIVEIAAQYDIEKVLRKDQPSAAHKRNAMLITYDKQGDVMYIQLKDGNTAGAWPANDFVNIYYTDDDKIAGIELFDVSKYADHMDEIAEKYDIKKVLQRD